MSRLYEKGAFMIGSQFRRSLCERSTRFPWHHWVRLAYFDALTWGPGASGGGVKAAWRFSEYARTPQNKPLMALAYELQHMKDEAPMVFDKLSYGDYTVAAAFTTIQAAGGPVMLDDFFYGRKDASSVSECNSLSNIPTANNYVENLKEKGFTDE